MELDLLISFKHATGNLFRNLLHLLVACVFSRGLLGEVDVVHVAAGAVGKYADKRWRLIGCSQFFFDELREVSEVIGRDISGTHAANVMQGIVRQQRDWPTIRTLHRNEADLRIGRAGGAIQLRAAARRVHPHAVDTTEGIAQQARIGDEPAAVEDFGRFIDLSPANSGRLQLRECPAHAVGNATGKELLIVGQLGFHECL